MNEMDQEVFGKAVRKALYCIPLYLLVPIGFWYAFHLAGAPLDGWAFLIGAGGWMAALVLRTPVALAVRNMPRERGEKFIVLASGPMEEIVRWALLLITGTALSWSASLGQGWAAIEVVYAVITIAALASLAGKTDEKSMEAKRMLLAQGNANASPLYGILERITASAFHIGATLVIAAQPWLVLVMIPVHSGLNLSVVHIGRRTKNPIPTQLAVGIVGTVTLIAGILLFQQ